MQTEFQLLQAKAKGTSRVFAFQTSSVLGSLIAHPGQFAVHTKESYGTRHDFGKAEAEDWLDEEDVELAHLFDCRVATEGRHGSKK
jgi:hypothetical protein